jgi:hypothetical protein
MRALALCLITCVALAAATASNADVPKVKTTSQALKILHTALGDAIKLERNALEQSKAGDPMAARSELENARALIISAEPAADFMAQPLLMRIRGKDDPWDHFNEDIEDIANLDRAAMREHGKQQQDLIQAANLKKLNAYIMVDDELNKPQCTELVNEEGPIKVNGVATSDTDVTISIRCRQRMEDVWMDSVCFGELGALASPPTVNAPAKLTAEHGDVIEIKGDGAKEITVTFQTTDPVTGEPLQVVPIIGDSSVPYDEVM